MADTITIAVKAPKKNWERREVENTLESFQEIVGGYIEGYFTNIYGVHFFCNEEGKFLNLEPNLRFCGDIICGTVFAVRSDDEGEFVSLTDEDLDYFAAF